MLKLMVFSDEERKRFSNNIEKKKAKNIDTAVVEFWRLSRKKILMFWSVVDISTKNRIEVYTVGRSCSETPGKVGEFLRDKNLYGGVNRGMGGGINH